MSIRFHVFMMAVWTIGYLACAACEHPAWHLWMYAPGALVHPIYISLRTGRERDPVLPRARARHVKIP